MSVNPFIWRIHSSEVHANTACYNMSMVCVDCLGSGGLFSTNIGLIVPKALVHINIGNGHERNSKNSAVIFVVFVVNCDHL